MSGFFSRLSPARARPQASAASSSSSLTVQPATPKPEERARYKALLIGICYKGRKYKDFGTSAELEGSHRDVQRVKHMLTKYYPYKEEDIVLMLDDGVHMPPTRVNIIEQMHLLVAGARVGDHMFLHYSGHGVQVVDQNGDEWDGYDEAIWPSDYIEGVEETYIIDDLMKVILVDKLPNGCQLTALFDSCHSGTILDLPKVWEGTPKAHLVELPPVQNSFMNLPSDPPSMSSSMSWSFLSQPARGVRTRAPLPDFETNVIEVEPDQTPRVHRIGHAGQLPDSPTHSHASGTRYGSGGSNGSMGLGLDIPPDTNMLNLSLVPGSAIVDSPTKHSTESPTKGLTSSPAKSVFTTLSSASGRRSTVNSDHSTASTHSIVSVRSLKSGRLLAPQRIVRHEASYGLLGLPFSKQIARGAPTTDAAVIATQPDLESVDAPRALVTSWAACMDDQMAYEARGGEGAMVQYFLESIDEIGPQNLTIGKLLELLTKKLHDYCENWNSRKTDPKQKIIQVPQLGSLHEIELDAHFAL